MSDLLPRSSSLPTLTHPISVKYSFRKLIGKGAYGTVWNAKHRETGWPVAIKKIGSKNFDALILAKRALRELKLLRHLHGNDNITTFIDAETNDTDPRYFNELYLVEGLMETDLAQVLKTKQKLDNNHFQYFTYQILRGLKWMHTANIIHRDLKPGNLLVNSDCELRICDFGLARGLPDQNQPQLQTEYVATRYYRAPEVILSPRHYGKALDLWSVGCILGELMIGRILFKGENYVDQLKIIFELLGTPEDKSLMTLCSPKVMKWIECWPRYTRIPFNRVFEDRNEDGLDLLDKLLTFDPSQRINAETAMAHPYMAPYHCLDDEPSHPKLFDFSFEKVNNIDEIKGTQLVIPSPKSRD
ncbi:kinase-like domain-containing protein [Gaertneriomyces semiglobifer]|nr:kinase-like domain-containing protein [Gaertneriomyces semiglobifer]